VQEEVSKEMEKKPVKQPIVKQEKNPVQESVKKEEVVNREENV